MWEADFAAYENAGKWADVVMFLEKERGRSGIHHFNTSRPRSTRFPHRLPLRTTGELSVLIHPHSTDSDYDDHTTNAWWCGPPVELRMRGPRPGYAVSPNVDGTGRVSGRQK